MSLLDWSLVVIYILLMIGLSLYWGRNQHSDVDYYVGGRKLPWWAVGLSVLATQSSAISFISIPAFVALRPGGGVKWLQYELAVPLAMAFILFFFVPFFRGLKLVSVFEFLEQRFGVPTARFLSVVFLLSRGLGTGVGVYATALVLSSMLEIPLSATILLIGVSALVYDAIGGITAVVYSDVIQLVLILTGAGICIYYGLSIAGGPSEWLSWAEPERLKGIQASWGWGGSSEDTAPFWAYLIGGFFLYSSYYGTDQSQVQRTLCTSSTEESRRSLILNGFARFPLTLLYVTMGIALGAAFQASPELQASVPAGRLDLLVPKFILLYIPSGLKGLILAAILAAAMSSLDSSINSLSAVTMRDHIERHYKLTQEQQLLWGQLTTVFWGVVTTGSAFLAGGFGKTVIEAINKVGSAFYGPVLATFFLGVITHQVRGRPMIVGVVVGVLANLGIWVSKAPVHWMWWNPIGFFVTCALTLGINYLVSIEKTNSGERSVARLGSLWQEERLYASHYLILMLYFTAMLTFLGVLHVILS